MVHSGPSAGALVRSGTDAIPLVENPSGAGTPSSILGASNLKFSYDASILTSLWQDSALTTPVAIDGNPVGGWVDQTATAANLLQPTAGKRFKYIANDGGYPAIESDGVDDFLQSGFFTWSQPFTIFAVIKVVTLVSALDYVWDGRNVDKINLAVGNTPTTRLYAGAAISYNQVVANAAYKIITAVYDNVNGALYENGVLRASGSTGAADPTWGTIGADPSGGQCGNIRFRELVGVNFIPTANQIAAMVAAYKAKWNVT